MKKLSRSSVFVAAVLLIGSAAADTGIIVPVSLLTENGIAKDIGTVQISETQYGLLFTPALAGLEPGLHGFHIHEFPNCGAQQKNGVKVAGLAAGGHFDPEMSKQHGTPWGKGHLGDLPALYVNPTGQAMYPVLAPRLKLSNVRNRSVMVHMGSDNHSDHPAPLGGGGNRVACGVIP